MKSRAVYLSIIFNESTVSLNFSSSFKRADVTLIHKMKSRLGKFHKRPFILIPKISKILVKCMHRQISDYFDADLPRFSEKMKHLRRLFVHGRNLQNSNRSRKIIWCIAYQHLHGF